MIKLFEQFNNEQEIHDTCKKYDIENYTINDDGSIDVDGDVNLYKKGLVKLPLKFNKVNGYFSCIQNSLTTMEGCPEYVGGDFNYSSNKLTTLEGSPKYVGGYFKCTNNDLTSLKGCSKYIGNTFICSNNPINKIDVECDIIGNIYLSNTNLDDKIKKLDQYYIKMLFKHGLDYNIFNEDGSINDSRLNHFLNDFKE